MPHSSGLRRGREQGVLKTSASEPRQRVNAHIYPSPMQHETRILKISGTLAARNTFDRIYLIGMASDGREERLTLDEKRSIWRLRGSAVQMRSTIAKAFHILKWSWSVWRALSSESIVCINAHSLSVLPLGVLLKKRHRAILIYDPHELETETASVQGVRRYLAKLTERRLIPYADEVSVVNDAIENWYRREYNLARVHVVKNVPQKYVLARRSPGLRRKLGIPSGALVFLYQGVVAAGRGIDIMLNAFTNRDDDKHLVVMGYGPLANRVRAASQQHANIHYHDPVPPEDLLEYTAEADVGLSLIENASLSYYYCLPNKLFEYLSVGLPVIASDLPCMADLIETHQCGWVIPLSGNAVATLISTIDRQRVDQLRSRALSVQAEFNWEREETALMAIYENYFGLRTIRSSAPAPKHITS